MPAFLRVKKPAVKFLRLGRKVAPAVLTPERTLAQLVGKAVFFGSDGERVAGKVAGVSGTDLLVKLAVPNRDGLLIVSDSEIRVKATDIEPTEALMRHQKVARFEAGMEIAPIREGDAKFAIIGDEKAGRIDDYLNVSFEGHASTFGTPQDRDRGGDYVLPGAFDDTLKEFRTNPVMLTDHVNKVASIAGSYSKVSVDALGLGVRGVLSNSPGVRDTRFKLVEGHLKGLSIGGIWYYVEDGYGIEEAKLFEISLVAIPMNPKTLAHTASIGELDCRKAFAGYWRKHSSLRDAA